MSTFIAFDGIDGCGKTSQSKLLFEFLKSRGFEVVLTKEPIDGAIGSFLRNVYLKELSLDNNILDYLTILEKSRVSRITRKKV